MFKAIWSEELNEYVSSVDVNGNNTINVSKLNLFIGANNTGKSRLIRKIFNSNAEQILLSGFQLPDKIKGIIELIQSVVPTDKSTPYISGKELRSITNNELTTIQRLNDNVDRIKTLIKNAINVHFNLPSSPDAIFFNQARQLLRQLDSERIKSIVTDPFKSTIPLRYYIPILRGMRPLIDGTDLLKSRTIKDYFTEGGTSILDEDVCKIVTGFDLFELLSKFLLGQPEERDLIRSYEGIIGQEFFGGEDVTLIPEYGKDTVSVKLGDERQFPIYDLGDGLQQVIIITSAAFLEATPSLFFIEEPEISLHPGLLRKLVVFLLDHTVHQFFITTHSNHLLDLAELRDDVIIQRLTKNLSKSSNEFHIRECTKEKEILTDLGVRASSVYLSNSTIWVEGITDRLYILSFMKKYLETLPDDENKRELLGFLENYHYAFIEYQGGTLGHWNFDKDDIDNDEDSGLCAIRLCTEAFLIADGDIKGKGERVKLLKEQLGDRFLILEGKEIENMLPENILRETAKRIFAKKRVKKDDLNVEAIDNVEEKKYKNSPNGIGYHLDKALGLKGKGKDNPKFFAADSGTIKDKVKFCKTTISVMNEIEWNNTDELNSLCEKIYNHIKTHNTD